MSSPMHKNNSCKCLKSNSAYGIFNQCLPPHFDIAFSMIILTFGKILQNQDCQVYEGYHLVNTTRSNRCSYIVIIFIALFCHGI